MFNPAYLKGMGEMELQFTDGITIDTGGPLRKLHMENGWYVVGNEFCIPVASEGEADGTIAGMTAGKQVCDRGED